VAAMANIMKDEIKINAVEYLIMREDDIQGIIIEN
jgi:hypothetical protein